MIPVRPDGVSSSSSGGGKKGGGGAAPLVLPNIAEILTEIKLLGEGMVDEVILT